MVVSQHNTEAQLHILKYNSVIFRLTYNEENVGEAPCTQQQ